MKPSTRTLHFTQADREAPAARRKTHSMVGTPITRHRRGRTGGHIRRVPVLRSRKVTPTPTRPTRPERATRIGRAKAAARISTPSRGDPGDDDDPHEPDGELTGRAAELAAELQAASDALIESWRVQSLAQAKHEQLSLDDRRWQA